MRATQLPLLLFSLLAPCLLAQEMEPRAFSPAPVGMQFFVVGAATSHGALVFDPSLPVEDAEATVSVGTLGYGRTFSFFGMTGKLVAVLPWANGHAEGLLSGEFVERNLGGLADPKLGASLLFFGAPAMNLAEFAKNRRNTIAGVSITMSVPLGKYEDDRVINISTNRWSVRSELGITHRRGLWSFELSGGVTVFGDNDDYLSTSVREQDPVWALQAHVVRDFRSRLWLAFDATYYVGGKSRVDGVETGRDFSNSRIGVTLSIPFARTQALKLTAASGISTRTGTDFDTFGLAWQLAVPPKE